MSTSLSNPRIGQKWTAKICDVHSSGAFVVSFEGQLLRIENRSRRKFNVGDRVELIVQGLNPISFRLASERKERSVSFFA